MNATNSLETILPPDSITTSHVMGMHLPVSNPIILGMSDIETFVYDYCEARMSRLSQLLLPF